MRSPLGMDFYKSLPITLKRIHEAAATPHCLCKPAWHGVIIRSREEPWLEFFGGKGGGSKPSRETRQTFTPLEWYLCK